MYDPQPKLYMHDDNEAMIAVCRTGRNATMRTLGRVHGVSTRALHEATLRMDFALGFISTKSMCADIHTKPYPEARSVEFAAVRRDCGVFSPEELGTELGKQGPGWDNYFNEPGKYTQRLLEDEFEDACENAPDEGNVEAMGAEVDLGPLWEKKGASPSRYLRIARA